MHINGVDIPVEVDMDVRSAKRSDSSGFKSLCPDCHDPLHQELACDEHGIITADRIVKGKEQDDGTYVVVTSEELTQAKTPDLEPGTFRFGSYDAKSLLAATIESGNVYRLRPSLSGKKKLPPSASCLQGYAILSELVLDRSIALIVEWTFRNVQKVYRLDLLGEQLVMRELIRPEEISVADDLDLPEIAPALIEAARDGLVVEQFDPALFTDRRQERIRILVEAKAKGEDPAMPTTTAAAEPAGLDLVAALSASLAVTTAPKKKRSTKAA